jgi:Domain of unknown function (DUF4280)
MSWIVSNKAKLTCSCGTSTSWIKSDNLNCLVEASPIVVETDAKPGVNIGSFGTCSITGRPCVPITGIWIDCNSSVQVGGRAVVLDKSKLPCAVGGVIQISDPGQGSVDG